MDAEIDSIVGLAHLIQSGEQYGYDASLLALGVGLGYVDLNHSYSLEAVGASDADKLHTQFNDKVQKRNKEFDSKFDSKLTEVEGELKKAQSRVRKKKVKPDKLDVFGMRVFVGLMATITGSLHAIHVIDQRILEARHVARVGMNREVIRASVGGMFARANIDRNARMNRHINNELEGLRSTYAELVRVDQSNSPLRNTAFHRQRVAGFRDLAHKVQDFRAKSAAAVQNSEKVLRESQSVLDRIGATRRAATDLAGAAAMPLYRRVGMYTMILLIHVILWYILVKVIQRIIKFINDQYED